MSHGDWAINLTNVSKTYNKKIHALRGIDMRVGRGEIFGLLGPNGAGKSTLVKIMMTVVLPDQASGTLLDQPLGHQQTLQHVGYLPEGHKFPPFLTARQALDFYGRLSKIPQQQRIEGGAKWLERLGMTRWADTPVSRYSKGMLQRLGMVQTLIHEPQLIVLDEPTDGVDPIGRKDIREILLEMKASGRTMFINSHILSELEMICDRVAILVDGQVARQGSIDELTAHTMIYQVTVSSDVGSIRSEIEKLGGRVAGRQITVPGNDASEVNHLVDLLRSREILIESIQPTRWSLEDVFIDAATTLQSQG